MKHFVYFKKHLENFLKPFVNTFNVSGRKNSSVKNSLQYKVILNPKHLYSDEDYNKIEYYSSLEYRFFEYLYRLDIDKLSETQQTNHGNLQRLLDDVMKHDKPPALEELIQRKWNELKSHQPCD